jgi:hypothetical protein
MGSHLDPIPIPYPRPGLCGNSKWKFTLSKKLLLATPVADEPVLGLFVVARDVSHHPK